MCRKPRRETGLEPVERMKRDICAPAAPDPARYEPSPQNGSQAGRGRAGGHGRHALYAALATYLSGRVHLEDPRGATPAPMSEVEDHRRSAAQASRSAGV